MNELLTHIWNYEAVLAHVAAGNLAGAHEVAAAALTQAQAEMAAWEEHFAAEALAEQAWQQGGAQLLADLTGAEKEAWEVPF